MEFRKLDASPSFFSVAEAASGVAAVAARGETFSVDDVVDPFDLFSSPLVFLVPLVAGLDKLLSLFSSSPLSSLFNLVIGGIEAEFFVATLVENSARCCSSCSQQVAKGVAGRGSSSSRDDDRVWPREGASGPLLCLILLLTTGV